MIDGVLSTFASAGISTYIIPDDVTTIGDLVFADCHNLAEITIGLNVVLIRDLAFYNCSGLTTAYIPSTITTITAASYSNSIFYSCSSSLAIYTDVSNEGSKPSGWGTYWNYRTSGTKHTTNYGVSLEEYQAIISQNQTTEFINEVIARNEEEMLVFRSVNGLGDLIIKVKEDQEIEALKEKKQRA